MHPFFFSERSSEIRKKNIDTLWIMSNFAAVMRGRYRSRDRKRQKDSWHNKT
jgi:hypothetical protein